MTLENFGVANITRWAFLYKVWSAFVPVEYYKVYIASIYHNQIIDMPLVPSCYHIHAVITVGWYNIGLYISTPLLLQGLLQINVSPLYLKIDKY